jgi:hypothetical protein
MSGTWTEVVRRRRCTSHAPSNSTLSTNIPAKRLSRAPKIKIKSKFSMLATTLFELKTPRLHQRRRFRILALSLLRWKNHF